MFIGGRATSGKKERGDEGEALALRYLQRQGMTLLARNYRVAAGPGRRAGEVDLVMRDRDGTVVFVEVRARSGIGHGGAAGSIGAAKRQRIILAARHYLMPLASPPPCRFDVVAIDAGRLQWLPAAFDAG